MSNTAVIAVTLAFIIAVMVLVNLAGAAIAQRCQIVQCTTIGNITTCTCI